MKDHLYQAQEEATLFPGFFDSRFKCIEYRKVGHYLPKGFLTMNLEKVTKTCPMLLEAWGSLYIKAQEEAGELLRNLWVLVFWAQEEAIRGTSKVLVLAQENAMWVP